MRQEPRQTGGNRGDTGARLQRFKYTSEKQPHMRKRTKTLRQTAKERADLPMVRIKERPKKRQMQRMVGGKKREGGGKEKGKGTKLKKA